MQRSVYGCLVKLLSVPVCASPNYKYILNKYGNNGLNVDGLVSIFAQENQYKVIKRNHLIKQNIASYCERYLQGEDILQLSCDLDFPPCMLMRRILEYLLPGNKQVVGDILKHPAKLATLLCGDTDVPQHTCDASAPTAISPHYQLRQHDNSAQVPRVAPSHTGSQTQAQVQASGTQCRPSHRETVSTSNGHDLVHRNAELRMPHAQVCPAKKSAETQNGNEYHIASCPSLESAQLTSSIPSLHTEGKTSSTCQTRDEQNIASDDASGRAHVALAHPKNDHNVIAHCHTFTSSHEDDDCQQQLPDQCILQQGSPEQQSCSRIQRDIVRCVMADVSYSPLCDAARQVAGQEHELLLSDMLRQAGIDYFWTEEDLRAQGCFKTPDIRLQVPIAVRPKGTTAWRVVSWIDSKATFGDDRIHNKQLEDQYSTYVNRYGSGLVIYWFGHLVDLAQHPDVLVLDHFPVPEELLTLPRRQPPGWLRPPAGSVA